jgi:hypothetical protein
MDTDNPSAIPSINPDIFGDDRWMSVHKRFVADTQEKEPEVVFVGDSIIAYIYKIFPVFIYNNNLFIYLRYLQYTEMVWMH